MDSVSVGRIVHYVDNKLEIGRKNLASIVTHVHDDGRVNLTVFHSTAVEHLWAVSQDEENRLDGTWHWPDRV